MHIVSSSINLQSQYTRESSITRSLARQEQEPESADSPDQSTREESISTTSITIETSLSSSTSISEPVPQPHASESPLSTSEDPDVRLIRQLLENLTGRDIPSQTIDLSQATPIEIAISSMEIEPIPLSAEAVEASIAVLDTARITSAPFSTLSITESVKEFSSFSAAGSILLDDGREIQLEMDKVSYNEYTLDISARFRDPLMVQLTDEPINLTNDTVEFDLNADGEKEEVHFATGNSKFLAFDRDGNGKIDDGSELFGAITGDGYQELAQYDDDGNGFIDSGDRIFDKLSLLSKNENGEDELMTLKDSGIGAFYLNRIATPQSLIENEEVAAQVRSSSIYIKENGEVGSTHQVDLRV